MAFTINANEVLAIDSYYVISTGLPLSYMAPTYLYMMTSSCRIKQCEMEILGLRQFKFKQLISCYLDHLFLLVHKVHRLSTVI